MKLELEGRTIGVATGGVPIDGDGPAIVLVHGAGMDRTVWQLQTRWLAHRGYRALAVDLPGHGNSDGPPLGTIEEAAAWLAALIEAADLAPAHLVGHSMGTYIATELAASQPGLVASLVLLGTAEAMPVHPALLEAASNDRPLASRLISGWGLSGSARLGANPAPGMWMVGATSALLDRSAEGVLATDLSACDRYERSAEAAAAARCPVTLVLGTADRMTPVKGGRTFADDFASAATVELAGAGHQLMTERPGEVCSAIVEAIER